MVFANFQDVIIMALCLSIGIFLGWKFKTWHYKVQALRARGINWKFWKKRSVI